MNFLGTTHPAHLKNAGDRELTGTLRVAVTLPECSYECRSTLASSQLFQLTAFPLVGAMIRLWAHQRSQSLLLAIACGTLDAACSFGVARLRLRRGTATPRQIQHVHFDRALGNGDVHALANPHHMRRLHAFAIELDLAAADGVSRNRSCLEQAYMPQPLVQAVAIVGAGVGCHERCGSAGTLLQVAGIDHVVTSLRQETASRRLCHQGSCRTAFSGRPAGNR